MELRQLKELEEMIDSFPPEYFLLKKAFKTKVKEVELEIKQNFYPSWASVIWSIKDFEGRAKELQKSFPEKNYQFDSSKYKEALETMIRKHDAALGISWDTVTHYLLEYCLKSFERTDYEDKLH